jgi:hypothetical protein
MPRPQSFERHARFVPLYHFVTTPLLILNVGWAVACLIEAPDASRAVAVLAAFAFMLTAFFARAFALGAQDRVIRLEMRLRLAGLLPPDTRARIPDLTIGQLVALRFASDAELPTLVASVLKDNIQDRKAIKRMIKDWQPDYARV